jgi:hypothetical protein
MTIIASFCLLLGKTACCLYSINELRQKIHITYYRYQQLLLIVTQTDLMLQRFSVQELNQSLSGFLRMIQ